MPSSTSAPCFEHALRRGIDVVDVEAQMCRTELVPPPRRRSDDAGLVEREELDAQVSPLDHLRRQDHVVVHFEAPVEAGEVFAVELVAFLDLEAEAFAIEAERSIEIAHADADVGR